MTVVPYTTVESERTKLCPIYQSTTFVRQQFIPPDFFGCGDNGLSSSPRLSGCVWVANSDTPLSLQANWATWLGLHSGQDLPWSQGVCLTFVEYVLHRDNRMHVASALQHSMS
jgi:hypothetical protein